MCGQGGTQVCSLGETPINLLKVKTQMLMSYIYIFLIKLCTYNLLFIHVFDPCFRHMLLKTTCTCCAAGAAGAAGVAIH